MMLKPIKKTFKIFVYMSMCKYYIYYIYSPLLVLFLWLNLTKPI